MNRRQVAGFLAFFALLALALAGRPDRDPAAAGRPPDIAALRERAALAPCPAGVSAALPDLTLPCLGGGPDVRLRAPAGTGTPTLVNVWATWCDPCVREADELKAFAAQAGGRVALLGVLNSDDPADALLFNADLGLRWPSVVDDDRRVLRAYASGPPVTLFVDSAGTVVHIQRGEFRSAEEIAALVRRHLGVQV